MNMSSMSNQPLPGEYPHYSQRYIELVPEEQIVAPLSTTNMRLKNFAANPG